MENAVPPKPSPRWAEAVEGYTKRAQDRAGKDDYDPTD